MEDEPKIFTNRELWLLIKSNQDTNLLQHQSIQDSIKDFHKVTKETLERIEAQTIKTNGSVRGLLLWQSYVKGSTWILPIIVSSIVSGIVGLIIYFAFKI